jgi:hypothetical protein
MSAIEDGERVGVGRRGSEQLLIAPAILTHYSYLSVDPGVCDVGT